MLEGPQSLGRGGVGIGAELPSQPCPRLAPRPPLPGFSFPGIRVGSPSPPLPTAGPASGQNLASTCWLLTPRLFSLTARRAASFLPNDPEGWPCPSPRTQDPEATLLSLGSFPQPPAS